MKYLETSHGRVVLETENETRSVIKQLKENAFVVTKVCKGLIEEEVIVDINCGDANPHYEQLAL